LYAATSFGSAKDDAVTVGIGRSFLLLTWLSWLSLQIFNYADEGIAIALLNKAGSIQAHN
jgi:hypothetical protein